MLIGNGWPDMAKAFRDERDLAVTLLVDPKRTTYQAMDFVRSVGSTFSWKGVGAAKDAFAQGHRQGATQGDPWQQGGVALVLPDGTMPWAYKSAAAGDHPTVDDVIGAVRAAG